MDSVSETIRKLEIMNAGSNIHTVNKALHYLKLPSYKTKNILAERCNEAIATNDWSIVKNGLLKLF